LQPDVGESTGQLIAKFAPVTDAFQSAGEGYLRLDPAKFASAFAADVPPAETEFMAASEFATAAAAFGAPVSAAAWHTKPSYAILTTQDHALSPDLQRWMYERSGAKVTIVAASHAVYMSQPKVVARVIEDAASGSK
jgi:pimeloyl-ACP methyl ester carboxylesterase